MMDALFAQRDEALDEPTASAAAAARSARVEVRGLDTLAELAEVVELYAAIWGRAETPPMTVELLRAFTKAGNYVSGAFDDGRLVGACVGFFHAPAQDALHSHIAGVAPGMGGRHIGVALKLHQRSWAIQRGVSHIAWTFDPLLGRNAYFNLAKLGADPVEYLVNFYGPMTDDINGTDDTDRLLVRWRLGDPQVVAAANGRRRDVPPVEAGNDVTVGLAVAADGGPRRGRLDGRTVLVAVPPDIGTLRTDAPEVATRWRHAVREALTTVMDDGGRIVGFDRAGWYVVRRHG